jgi:hypothetical protein
MILITDYNICRNSVCLIADPQDFVSYAGASSVTSVYRFPQLEFWKAAIYSLGGSRCDFYTAFGNSLQF